MIKNIDCLFRLNGTMIKGKISFAVVNLGEDITPIVSNNSLIPFTDFYQTVFVYYKTKDLFTFYLISNLEAKLFLIVNLISVNWILEFSIIIFKFSFYLKWFKIWWNIRLMWYCIYVSKYIFRLTFFLFFLLYFVKMCFEIISYFITQCEESVAYSSVCYQTKTKHMQCFDFKFQYSVWETTADCDFLLLSSFPW